VGGGGLLGTGFKLAWLPDREAISCEKEDMAYEKKRDKEREKTK